MIKSYPNFSELQLGHYDQISSFTAGFEPYSDFNFLSLFAWNIDGSTAVSFLNDNLVVKLPYYITGQTVLSVLGKRDMNKTVETLLTDTDSLKLVPSVVRDSSPDNTSYRFIADEANYDYIYNLTDHVTYTGNKLRIPRNEVNKILKAYGENVQVHRIDVGRNGKIHQLIDLFGEWSSVRGKIELEIENERTALMRLLQNATSFNMECFEVEIDGRVAGFSINEVLPNNFANCHFQKCITEYKGLDAYLTQQVSIELIKMGCTYINWEQDLGIAGLRQQKRSYAPIKMLQKFVVV